MFKFLLLLITLSFTFVVHGKTGYDHAVILQYHHVSNSTPPITSVTAEQLEQHLNLIQKEGFQVLPLPQVIETLQQGNTFDKPTAVITFDDAYESIYTAGFPLLKEYQYPFTIFISPKPVEDGFTDMLSWGQLKEMQAYGATMANHSYQHDHLAFRLEGESDQEWLERIRKDTEQAQASLEHHLGSLKKYMAYPYGEFDEQLKSLMKEMGYIAFGQQSGPIHQTSEYLALPRFPASGIYANTKTLKTKLNSRAFHLIEELPKAQVRSAGDAVPELILKVKDNGFRHKQVQCFFSGNPVETKTSKDEHDIVVIQAKAKASLSKGRSRYNCTAPSEDGSNYFWHSKAFVAQ
ncbi:polysaccharide deacetylase family protein [Bermanella marisrubri]|uniref:Putative polysaccharide deacetylase family protein n=1 Tax=Bermanella marisrubri TaxID=207949 RepID=Q1N670_9GAMM|nr:polysaccharide deacetylase family protein [Bermanella marisrubri]EAT13722.1 putative polysaccharide deacetylase family protein [Oceanobacter sp. RED65] [Bermanella marisrubri]QIZ84498.1 polysaccharide deacetylase family protein [Bermanella marisrubri]